ncbi:CubicO group peptidase, beta-lactamase class C family [bacterium A37T11]|nr:CubicO group peptidase, beta-lactamase class C family [bacterium A37T11]
MVKNSIKIFSVILLMGILQQIGHAQTAEAEIDIQHLMKQYEAVGLSVAVVKHNQVIYTHSFGLKDLENGIPLTDRDIFRIASISKSFSATSIMQLIHAGKLSLEDDVSDLLGFKVRNPKYPDKKITLKMILSHRSSINDSQGYFTLDAINPSKNPNWAKCYNDYEPDNGYQYCNLNFNIVGTILEITSGERFDQYVKHHVLDPLGLYGGYCVDSLDQTRFVNLYEYNDSTKQFSKAADAYKPNQEIIRNYKMGYNTPVFSPTGGMKISATDLARYMIMHMNYGKANGISIMPKKYAKLMQKQISNTAEGYGMAMMNFYDLVPGEHMVGHSGNAYGLYSSMFFEPKMKFGIVVITNGCHTGYTGEYNNFTRAVLNSLYNHLIK